MRGEVHPVLAQVPDTALAESLSEQFLHLGEFKISSKEVISDGFTAEDGFPPIPAEPVGMVHAYLEHDGDDSVRRQSVLNPLDKLIKPTFIEDFLQSYGDNLAQFHDIMANAAQVTPGALDDLRDIAIIKTRESGLRTVAAFAFMQTPDTQQYFGGFLIPRRLYTDLPAQQREILVSIRGILQNHGIDMDKLLTGKDKEIHRGMLQGDVRANTIAFFAGALMMPTVAELTPAIEAQRSYLFPHSEAKPKADKPAKVLPPKARNSRGRTTPKGTKH